jgi:thymidine kinase
MFGGKTSRLLELYTKAEGGLLVTPDIDTRYSSGKVCSHDGQAVDADIVLPVESTELLLAKVSIDTKEIFIDEINLFPEVIISVIDSLLQHGYKVTCSGLLKDFRNVDFPVSRIIYDMAYIKEEKNAKCAYPVCNRTAKHNQRLKDGYPVKATDPVIMVGGSESYEPRCSTHYILLK